MYQALDPLEYLCVAGSLDKKRRNSPDSGFEAIIAHMQLAKCQVEGRRISGQV